MASTPMMIGTRVLRLREADREVKVPVRLFAPEKGDGGGWFCRYQIGWPEEPHDYAGWGADAVQAILLTLEMIGIEIYVSEYHKSGRLMWEAPGKGYGFPVPRNARDLLIGDDAAFGA